jgi:cysteinyl-tRNA synthetase
MTISLYNTLSGRVEPFAPERLPQVRMYVCGPTVYARAHIGNFRTFVATDLLRRTLEYKGYQVLEVMNLTDVEDRIIKFAADAGQDLAGYTAPHVQAFLDDLDALRFERPEVMPKATEHVPEMVALVSQLIERGHTYAVDGSVYFRIASFADYGKLSRLDVAGIKAGARVDNDRYDKENARDFVLWKAKTDEPAWAQWDAPFGRGRPGWHLECSAMAMKYLGETFDLHCGGVDLMFPHHENEIAQATCGTGQPFVRHWAHVEHLRIDDETMSKSKGNVFTLPEIVERGHDADAVRYLLSSGHYRRTMNFTWESLTQAAAAIERVRSFATRLGEVDRDGPAQDAERGIAQRADHAFDGALCDDLNTPEALAAVHGLVSEGNALLASGALTRDGAAVLQAQLERMNGVFAVLLPREDRLSAQEQALFDGRQEARKARDFARADALREELEAMGVAIEDTPKGARWRRKR